VTGSLRKRLLIGIIGTMILLLTVFSLTVYTLIRRSLINQFDETLLSIARIMAVSVERDGNKIELEHEVQQMLEFQNKDNPTYFQIWDNDGRVVAKSTLLETNDLPYLNGSLNVPVFRAIHKKGSRPERVVGLKFLPRNESDDTVYTDETAAVVLVVAADAVKLYSQVRFVQWLLLATCFATIVIAVIMAAFMVRRGLGPLNSLATQIAAVREDDLTARITAENMPAEVVPIRNRLNDLLSRLENSFNRERRFTADVAHELRTPLSGMRTALEVALSRMRDANEYQSTLSDCLAISKDMQAMVSNLLAMARIDAHQMTFQLAQIQPAELVNSCWQAFSDKAARRGIVFDNRIPDELTLRTDRESLSMVLSNLLDNAVEYSNNGGRIWTTGRKADDYVEITFANTGCRLTNEQAAQVFDCFWRADCSRANTGTHCGLGLALVHRIIDALGGSTSVEVQPEGMFTIRVILPA
jgi:two-component system heavy metal sensor histidine kinase CusS